MSGIDFYFSIGSTYTYLSVTRILDVEKVKPIAEKFGGDYIIRGGTNQIIEGTWQYSRTVVIKFPSYKKALEWYNSEEYQPIKKIRLVNANTNGIIIQGA